MIEALLLLCGTTLVVLGSPGPAPLALAATGAGFGLRGGLPFLGGILAGLTGVALLTALGAGALLLQGGALAMALLAVSLGYFVYVAYKVATAPLNKAGEATGSAPTARDGLILNLTNPKAYAALAALYAGFGLPVEPVWLGLLATGTAVMLVAALLDAAWLALGGVLAPVFASPRFGRPLRIIMALTMLLAVAGSIGLAILAA